MAYGGRRRKVGCPLPWQSVYAHEGLAKAKGYAIEMVKGIRPGKVITDPIRNLHHLHLKFAEPTPSLAEIWAIETSDYPPLTMRRTVSVIEAQSADCPLEYYPDDYPKLPDCLRRSAF